MEEKQIKMRVKQYFLRLNYIVEAKTWLLSVLHVLQVPAHLEMQAPSMETANRKKARHLITLKKLASRKGRQRCGSQTI